MILAMLAERYGLAKPLSQRNVLICTHATEAALRLVLATKQLGAKVTFTPIPYSRKEQFVQRMHEMGVEVVEPLDAVRHIIGDIDILMEDGARVTELILADSSIKLREGFFAIEQTTSGARILQSKSADQLRYPVINVAESLVKLHIENAIATPEAVLAAFHNVSGLSLTGKNVLLLGYGFIGSGIGRLCRQHGAHVTIAECAAVRRMQSNAHGIQTISSDRLAQLLPDQDIVISCTSNKNGVGLHRDYISILRDGAVIFNAGSGNGEIDESLLTPGVQVYHGGTLTISQLGDDLVCQLEKCGMTKTARILAGGHPINLRAGNGTPSEVIEFVFAMMLLAGIRGCPLGAAPMIIRLDNLIEQEVAELAELAGTRSAKKREPRLIHGSELRLDARPYGGVKKVGIPGEHLDGFSLAWAVFHPGEATEGHHHLITEEAYVVEHGMATMTLWHYSSPEKKCSYGLQPGDVVTIPREYVHHVQVTSDDDFICLVIASPPFSLWDQFFSTT
jgi:adenosylhomocysteinase